MSGVVKELQKLNEKMIVIFPFYFQKFNFYNKYDFLWSKLNFRDRGVIKEHSPSIKFLRYSC